MKLASTIALLTVSFATAFAQKGAHDLPAGACADMNDAATALAANGRLAEAEALLGRATVSGGERDQGICTGRVLANVARVTAVLGRIAEAGRLAEQSLRILENFYPPDDWVLLYPLQVIASVRLESGNIARAREALRRIRAIRIDRPEDSAIVHATMGALLQMEGRRSEAETEYQDALRAWEEAGRSESTDVAVIFHSLGALYLAERRLDEARRVLDQALVIHNRAKDSVPIDRVRFLYLRGVLHARLGEWQQSEQDLRDALSLADRQPYVDPDFLRSMFGSYSTVLRRNHHRREARCIEARRAALPTNSTTAGVVDSTELLLERKAAKKESIR